LVSFGTSIGHLQSLLALAHEGLTERETAIRDDLHALRAKLALWVQTRDDRAIHISDAVAQLENTSGGIADCSGSEG
jgi:hypothetical protein